MFEGTWLRFLVAGATTEGYTEDVADLDRITMNPAQMSGQPCIRGLRITVRRVLDALGAYPDRASMLTDYPELEDEDIRQALAYAAAMLDDKVIDLPASA